MTTYYSLQINVSDDKFEIVDKILEINSNSKTFWELKLVKKENNENFVDYFLSILANKYDQLAEIGIKRNDISIWFVYYYDGQCNMEISPKNMYKLGKAGVTFCISCYDIHDYNYKSNNDKNDEK
jgi:hypothetical protein